jgi:hypothetical protein
MTTKITGSSSAGQVVRAAKGTGTQVSAELKDHPDLLAKIRAAAQADDREVSNYLRRRLVELDRKGLLIEAPQTGSLFAEK